MASPQLEDGYTRIANELFDAIIRTRLPGQELRIMLAIIRMTYGFGKKQDQISYGQLSKITKIPRRKVIEHVKNLVSKKALGSAHHGTRQPLTFWINKDFEQWEPSALKGTSAHQGTMPSAHQGTNLVPIRAPTKERKKEEKEIRAEIPSWISSECFEEFKKMRKKIKKPMTKRAEELVIKELGKLKEKGSDPNEVLEQSIRNDWQDVYPIKEKGNGNQKTRSAVDEGLARFLASADDPRRD
jgi:phage replication O-like protein O